METPAAIASPTEVGHRGLQMQTAFDLFNALFRLLDAGQVKQCNALVGRDTVVLAEEFHLLVHIDPEKL